MATVTKAYTVDAWIGPTRQTYTVDAIISKLANTKTYTTDAYLKKRKTYTVDAIVADNRGSFRGEGTLADRNALAPLYAGDTFKVYDDALGQHMHYYDGASWSSQRSIQVQESGQERTRRTPNASGGAAIQGDSTYPFLLNSGISRVFSIDGTGILFMDKGKFGYGPGSLNENSTITLPEAVTYMNPSRVQAPTATSANKTVTVAWASSTTAGNLLVFVATNNGGTAVATPPTGFTIGGTLAVGATNAAVIYYKANCSNGEANPAITFTSGSAGGTAAVALEYQNMDTSTPLDRTRSATTTQTGDVTVGNPNPTTVPVEVWLAVFSSGANLSGDVTPGWGTVVANLGSGVPTTANLTLVEAFPTATDRPSCTVTVAQADAAAIATFKAATSSPAVGTPSTGKIVIYAKDNAGTSALYYKDDGGTEHGPL